MKLESTPKKNRYIGLIVIFVIIIILGLRACTGMSHPKEKYFVVAYNSTWYPLNLGGKEQSMVAFCKDVLHAIFTKSKNYHIAYVEVGSSVLLEGLQDENYNAVLTSLVPNAVNRRQYEFSDPLYPLGPVLVVKVGSPITDITDIKGKVIGVEQGTQQLYQITEESDFVMIPYRDVSSALESLDRNVVDAVVMDAFLAITYTRGYYKGRLKIATSPLIDGGIRVATLFTPESEQFVEEFNAGLKKIMDEGVYDSLLKKWGIISTEIKKE